MLAYPVIFIMSRRWRARTVLFHGDLTVYYDNLNLAGKNVWLDFFLLISKMKIVFIKKIFGENNSSDFYEFSGKSQLFVIFHKKL
jgi:hypothetical protein